MPISWGDIDWYNLGREAMDEYRNRWVWAEGLRSWIRREDAERLRIGNNLLGVIWLQNALWFWEYNENGHQF